jgi:holo-[acyl-carrier protein] synthase
MHRLPLVVASVAALPAVTDPLWRRLLSVPELVEYGSRRRAGEHLTARAMARLALASALGWPGEVPWQELAIRKEPSGRPVVVLSGGLAEWCREAGLPVPAVSLTHAAGHAAALAWLPGQPSPGLRIPELVAAYPLAGTQVPREPGTQP